MNKIVNLSLAKKSVPVRMDVVQYATKPNIVFVLDDYLPGLSAVASLYIEKPDGTKIYNACTIDGNQVTYEPTTQSFASLGINKCQLQIIESNDTAVSFLVYADVTENIIDSSAIESQDEFTALEQAIQTVGDITEIENRVTIAEENIVAVENRVTSVEEGKYDLGTYTTASAISTTTIAALYEEFKKTCSVNARFGSFSCRADITYINDNFGAVVVTSATENATFRFFTLNNGTWTETRQIKSKTVTGTTNALGNLNLNLAITAGVAVAVSLPSGSGRVAWPFLYSGTAWWGKIITDGATWQPLINTSVTATVFYY